MTRFTAMELTEIIAAVDLGILIGMSLSEKKRLPKGDQYA
jgi:hypothetical protein